MKKLTFLALVISLLSLFPLNTISAENTSEMQVVSDAAAGCTYGTKPLTSADYLPAGTVKNFEQIMNYFNTRDKCSVFFNWAPLSNFPQGVSYVKVSSGTNTDPESTEHLCVGAGDPSCSAANWKNGTLWATSVFYKCQSPTDLNCIVSLDVIDASGNLASARYLRNFPDTAEIPGYSWEVNGQKFGYSKGGAVPLWEFTGPNGPIKISTIGIIERTWLNDGKNWERPSATFQLSLSPVSLSENSPGATKPVAREIKRQLPNGKEVTFVATDSPNPAPGRECEKRLVLDSNSCLKAAEFPPGYSYRVTMQMPDDIAFFLNGRIQEPIAYTEPISGGRKIVIEGKPATSFVAAGLVPKAVLKPDVVNYLKNNQHLGGRFFQAPGEMPFIENRYLDLLNLMLPYFGDFTTYEEISWNLQSTPSLGSVSGPCLNEVRGQLLGIVSTNATAFDGNPPTFEPGTKMISYQVAAPHLSADGKTLNVGRYYMNANAKFMSCLLKVTKVPDVATVGIDYANNEKFVTTVSVKTDKDWVRLKADNFHFSSPKINISFSSEAKPSPAADPSGQSKTIPKATAAKKSTISCLKGKTVKKVTSVNPTCPPGFKKK